MNRTIGAATAMVLLAAALGGAMSSWIASYDSTAVSPDPTTFTRSLDSAPLRESVTPDGQGGYTTVVEQVGRVVSVSDSSLIVASADGTVKTYVITTETTVVTVAATESTRTRMQFEVSEIVSVVGTVEDGITVATVVANQGTANGNGPPMDG
jgi:hypothetical protein